MAGRQHEDLIQPIMHLAHWMIPPMSASCTIHIVVLVLLQMLLKDLLGLTGFLIFQIHSCSPLPCPASPSLAL